MSEEGASRIDLTSVFTPFAAIVISLALIWSIGLKLLGTVIRLRKEVRETKRELQKALDLLEREHLKEGEIKNNENVSKS